MAMTKETWTAPPDGACVNCRARKVRCGRERPRCGNCRRDGAECAYSSPLKRVNHIKVLCQNFEDIQTRLIMVQEDLSVLTSMVKQTNIADRLKRDVPNDSSQARTLPIMKTDRHCMENTAGHTGGHVFRNAGTLIEQYHGMWTLVSQCHDFAADAKLSILANSDETVKEMTERQAKKLTHDAVVDDSTDFSNVAANEAVRLPSKQFLGTILDTFFKLVDHNTDISEPQITYEALERVYKEPVGPSTEAWAVYFNLIILVVLGAESPNLIDDPFIRPALQASQVAVNKPSIFLAPKLINVQTLALLSLLAYNFQNEVLGDRIFMQACILAKAMGLDQSINRLQASNLSDIEASERRKVYESLYIRDQCAAITRGTISWLSNTSSNIPPVNLRDVKSHASSNCPSRHNLAQLQCELLSILTPGAFTSQDQCIALSQLQDRLHVWSQDMNVPSTTPPSTIQDVSMHLAFLSTRIRLNQALHGYDAKSSKQLLHDSRLCCLLVVASCYRPVTDDHWRKLCSLLGPEMSTTPPLLTSPSSLTSMSSLSSTPESPRPAAAESARLSQRTMPSPALSIHRLWASFPPAALFILSRNIMQIRLVNASTGSSEPPKSRHKDNQQCTEAHDDFLLLDTLRQIIQPVDTDTNASFPLSCCTAKLGTVVQHVVELLSAVTQPRTNLTDTLTPMSLLLQEPSGVFDLDGLGAYGLQVPETPGLTWPVSSASDVVLTSESGYSSTSSKGVWYKQVTLPQFSDQMTTEGISWPIKLSNNAAEGHRVPRSERTTDEFSSRSKKRQRRSPSRSNSSDCRPASMT